MGRTMVRIRITTPESMGLNSRLSGMPGKKDIVLVNYLDGIKLELSC